MTKTKEELQELKKEITALANKLEELNEDELNEIVGARKDITIKPSDDDFWHSYNPNFLDDDHGLNVLDFLNKVANGNVDFNKTEFNGSISNREDENK